MQADAKAWVEVAGNDHGRLGVEHGASREATPDGFENDAEIEAGAAGEDEGFAHGGDVAGDHNLVCELGDIAGADWTRERNTGSHGFEDGQRVLVDHRIAPNHDGKRTFDRLGLSAAD